MLSKLIGGIAWCSILWVLVFLFMPFLELDPGNPLTLGGTAVEWAIAFGGAFAIVTASFLCHLLFFGQSRRFRGHSVRTERTTAALPKPPGA